MRISLSEAEGQLPDLVRRAEAGDDIILTRHGHEVARLVPIRRTPDRDMRKALMEAAQASAATKVLLGPTIVSGQDFLYDDSGLPG